MPTKTSPILPKKNEGAASKLALGIVGGIMAAARSLKDAAVPIARDIFALRVLFVDSSGIPDVTGSSQAYRTYVKENVWDIYRKELELTGESTVLNLSSFQETVQRTVRENLDAWVQASDLDDSTKDALRQASDAREETRKKNEKNREENPVRDNLTELRKSVNSSLSSSRKSKENPAGTLDYSGFIGNAAEMLEQVQTAVVGKTTHGITPKQAAHLLTQLAALGTTAKSIGATLRGIARSEAAAKKNEGSKRNPRTGGTTVKKEAA